MRQQRFAYVSVCSSKKYTCIYIQYVHVWVGSKGYAHVVAYLVIKILFQNPWQFVVQIDHIYKLTITWTPSPIPIYQTFINMPFVKVNIKKKFSDDKVLLKKVLSVYKVLHKSEKIWSSFHVHK